MSDRSVLWSNDVHAARCALETLLTECQGNVTLASRRAGIERQSMHRLLKRHGLSARDFRPRGGGSIIARAALKNLDQQLTARAVSRDFSRSVVREAAEVRGIGVTVTHPTAAEQLPARERTAASSAIEHASASASTDQRAAVVEPRAPGVPSPASTSAERRRERASLASPSFERASGPPRRPTEPLIERPITAGELADRAYERRHVASPHHRPYQSPLGAAALAALALRKTVAG